MNCQCGNPAARDCSYGRCGGCCPGCERHPSEECCDICEYLLNECECTTCNGYCYERKLPYDCEYRCTNCGCMCEGCFGEGYITLDGDTYCSICGDGMRAGGNDNRGPRENW